jgi:hypothetical protein
MTRREFVALASLPGLSWAAGRERQATVRPLVKRDTAAANISVPRFRIYGMLRVQWVTA